MKQIGAYEAKVHLSELLDQVAQGETILITKKGKPVAKMVPVESDEWTWEKIVHRLYQLRKNVKPGTPSIREMIEEGRRF
ncbi:type II toxin-antitoxin system Phd/YefM family antitoxin [Kyrpidia tusciae]|uniref:Antitoxin n=1 Tax=Kyrpidia tusciae (strain DSM 2912 / NBRC 15312 / T2) TaxID=562970 RepID=D5WT53_KYRT2|nr:type II toxin-antitoxin system prevent-host-death family antitoxin [Kyrpidia tusciae]ADG05157.1 prevent-host-death family protein [Kyrpidia tusciae DSM 2912]